MTGYVRSKTFSTYLLNPVSLWKHVLSRVRWLDGGGCSGRIPIYPTYYMILVSHWQYIKVCNRYFMGMQVNKEGH